MEIRLSELIGQGFGVSRAAVRGGCTELVESGGRGSGKSSYLSLEFLLQLFKHPQCHGVVIRKVAATLRNSVYAQLQWAIEKLALAHCFRMSLSPMEMEYLPTGQKILFFGMDDPDKLKSLKLPRGYVGLLWFEELDQFEEGEVGSVELSVFRGGDFSLCLKSFNPPPDPEHWVNRLEDKPGRFFHRSTYLELPPAWLGSRFLADAEHWKQVNPVLYQHTYLGIPVGQGERVFPNLRLQPLPPNLPGQAVCGVDWGWWPDPWAFDRVAYDPQSRTLFVLEEDRGNRLTNRETGCRILSKVGDREYVMADSSEPKSIADYRALGLCCRAVKKGPGSRRYGYKWLQSLNAIVIDPVRCPETAREFRGCAYQNGNYPEKDDHHIDAVRYASSIFWRMDNPQ